MGGISNLQEIVSEANINPRLNTTPTSTVDANQRLFQSFNPNSANPYGQVTTGTTNYGYVAPGNVSPAAVTPANNAEAVTFNNNVTPPGQSGSDAALDASRSFAANGGATRSGALGDGTRGSPAEANTGVSVFGGYSGAKDMIDGGGRGASTLGGRDFQGPNPNGSAGNDGPSGGK